MAGIVDRSADLFADLDNGLDSFGLGDGTMGDNRLMDGLMNNAPVTSDGPTDTIPVGATGVSANEQLPTPTTSTNSGGRSGTSSNSPPDVSSASSQQDPQQQQSQHQALFFNPMAGSQWTFQNAPSYDSPANAHASRYSGAVPQPTWDFSLGLNQGLQQQQPSPFPAQSSAPPVSNSNFEPTTAAGSVSLPPASAPMLQSVNLDSVRTLDNLTPAQRELLKTIAMPAQFQYQSPQSPGSSSSGPERGMTTSPGGTVRAKSNMKKRKSLADDDDDDDEDDTGQPIKKTAHNMIEKRYRTNLNDKIAALRDSVPSLRIMSKSARGEDTTEDREELHGLTPAHKLNKATVLSKATEYIRHLEKRNNRLLEENSSMQARIAAFEKLFMAGAMNGQAPNPMQQSPTPVQYPQDNSPYLNTLQTPRGADPQGMIPIPDDMKRILASQQLNAGRPYPVPAQQFNQTPAIVRQQQIQQQQQQQQQQAQVQAGRWNPYVGKLMVGSLAGLMLVEALVESEPSEETADARGLAMLPPVRLLSTFVQSTHFSVGGYYVSAIDLIAKLRLVSLLGFFLWLVYSSFFDVSAFEPAKKTKGPASVVKAVPSLASPIHVRRQAWLTAIQTVWVPRHNFFLEAAALLLKATKYTLRNVIGPHGYLALTGLTQEQETARIKAWSIALDAQLAGGDVEINKSRLTLTLIASGTLPDSPLRLMLKALHIRILLWRLGGVSWAANVIAAKLARSRWNEARQLNRILNSLPEGEHSPLDALPDHLAALLEQDCDEVFSDDVIQRAHNLAWNHATTYNAPNKIDGMDAVVEDPAVRSPMDAVAAWYSHIILHRALVTSLRKSRDDLAVIPGFAEAIALAVSVAPIGSNAQVRAVVTRAVLADGKRGAHIVAAMQALGPSTDPDKHPDYSNGVPPLIDSPMTLIAPDPDAQMALRCAMAIAQLQKFNNPPAAAFTTIDSILPRGSDIEDMSLLGFTGAYHLVNHLSAHPVGRETCSRSLERLAGSLRIWMGSEQAAGQKSGLDTGLRSDIIDKCLAVTKSVVGMDVDLGYVSMEECGAGEDGNGGENGGGGC